MPKRKTAASVGMELTEGFKKVNTPFSSITAALKIRKNRNETALKAPGGKRK